jgi:hypothetical protein
VTGTTGLDDGRESSAVRPSRLRRLGAACFLSAGAYVCISLGTQALAQAEEPAPVPPQSETGTTESALLATDLAAVPVPSATQPPTDPPTTPVTSIPETTGRDTTTAPPAEPGEGPAPADPATTPATVGTASLVASDDGTSAGAAAPDADVAPDARTVGTATEADDVAGTASDTSSICPETMSSPADSCGVPVFGAVPAGQASALPGVACVVPAGADPTTCGGSIESTSIAGTPAARGDTTSAGALTRTAALVPAQPIVTASPSATGSHAPSAPVAPPRPLVPATAVTALAGCSSTSADPHSARGPAAAVAAVLGGYSELSLAVTDAARTAPAEGSPASAANDPSARPD